METGSLKGSDLALIAAPNSVRCRTLRRNSALRPARSQLSLRVARRLAKPFQKPDQRKASFDITYRRETFYAQTHASNAGSLEKSRALTSTTMSRFEFVGSVDPATFDGTKPNPSSAQFKLRSNPIVARWEKYTGQKAELISG